jgi:hypothetical protein
MRLPAHLLNPMIGASLFRFSNPARWKLIRGAQPGRVASHLLTKVSELCDALGMIKRPSSVLEK